MRKTVSLTAFLFAFFVLSAEEKDLLSTVKWRVIALGGAKGSATGNADGTVKLTRSGDKGVV